MGNKRLLRIIRQGLREHRRKLEATELLMSSPGSIPQYELWILENRRDIEIGFIKALEGAEKDCLKEAERKKEMEESEKKPIKKKSAKDLKWLILISSIVIITFVTLILVSVILTKTESQSKDIRSAKEAAKSAAALLERENGDDLHEAAQRLENAIILASEDTKAWVAEEIAPLKEELILPPEPDPMDRETFRSSGVIELQNGEEALDRAAFRSVGLRARSLEIFGVGGTLFASGANAAILYPSSREDNIEIISLLLKRNPSAFENIEAEPLEGGILLYGRDPYQVESAVIEAEREASAALMSIVAEYNAKAEAAGVESVEIVTPKPVAEEEEAPSEETALTPLVYPEANGDDDISIRIVSLLKDASDRYKEIEYDSLSDKSFAEPLSTREDTEEQKTADGSPAREEDGAKDAESVAKTGTEPLSGEMSESAIDDEESPIEEAASEEPDTPDETLSASSEEIAIEPLDKDSALFGVDDEDGIGGEGVFEDRLGEKAEEPILEDFWPVYSESDESVYSFDLSSPRIHAEVGRLGGSISYPRNFTDEIIGETFRRTAERVPELSLSEYRLSGSGAVLFRYPEKGDLELKSLLRGLSNNSALMLAESYFDAIGSKELGIPQIKDLTESAPEAVEE